MTDAPRRRRGWTLQTRLMVTVIGIVALILIGSAAAISATVGRVMTDTIDANLNSSVRMIQLVAPGYPSSLRTAEEVLSSSPAARPGFLLVVDAADGQSSAAVVTSDGDVESLDSDAVAQLRSGIVPKEFTTVSVGDYGSFRAAPFVGSHGNLSVIVGLSLTEQNATLARIVGMILIVTIAGLGMLGAAIALVIRQSLRPLRAVADTATRVAQLPLAEGSVAITERVPAAQADPHTETGQVGAALNTLLDHVDASLTARQHNEEKMRSFVADASHELRTPLASIRGYSELSLRALSTQDPTTAAESTTSALQRIQAQSLRMTSLVEDLLLLARLDEGQELVMSGVDLTRLAVESLADAQVAGRDHEWSLDVPDESVMIIGDGARMHQVLANLLANARVHTPAGTHVELRVSRDDGHAVVRVRDDGPGIEDVVAESLFERFARADRSRARKTGGTGLGLSIVQAIVSAHDGTITVESTPGNTVFEVRLPLAPQQP